MSTFARYLGYRLKNTAFRILVITVMSVIISLIVISDEIALYRYYLDTADTDCCMYMLTVVLCIVGTLIPMLETSAFKNKRNLDTLYFLPIKREKLASVHFLSGFIQVLFTYTVTYLIASIYLCINAQFMNLGYLIPLYFASVGLGFVLYSFFIFIFTQANTAADGVLFSLAWMFVPALVMENIDAIFNLRLDIGDEQWGIVYVPLNNITTYFQNHIEIRPWSEYTTEYMQRIEDSWIYFLAWGVIGVLCAVGYVISFVKKGAEKAGDISESVFGYKTLIPFYLYTSLFLGSSSDYIVVMFYICAVIGYIIYRRGVRFKKSDIICLACSIIPVLLRGRI